MSYKHPYKYHQLLAQILICLLAFHLAQCQQCSNPVSKPKPDVQLDDKEVAAIKDDFLRAVIKDLQAGKAVDIAKQAPTDVHNY